MTKNTTFAGVTVLAGMTAVFLVGRTTAPTSQYPTTVAAQGVIQQGACLPPSVTPDPCIAASGTLTNALYNLGRSSYFVQWRKAYPKDYAMVRAYANSVTIGTPATTTVLGAVIAGIVQAARYAHASTVTVP